ncbi:MAG TPA: helix-turn-helix domain-containing protein [Solirubrobacteraceae bacterium]|nr:helix-turn-helix domain-containing protein [Solirubrobacteraceae bacterium]
MNDQEPTAISIALSPTQVDHVVRAASRGSAPSISALIAGSLAKQRMRDDVGEAPGGARAAASATEPGPAIRGYVPSGDADPRLSRSLLRGLSLLTGFGPDGGERGIVELAEDLGMSPSTAHRYALTLVEVGLLERCPRTRKYRLPQAA